MWPLDPIADAALDALRARDAALREEHAVYGLDVLDELSFHPLIAAGLAASGVGVLREQPYPHEWFRKLRPGKSGLDLPILRDRMRCDLVLTPAPNQKLDDSLLNEKRRRADAIELQGTLFESLSQSHLAPGAVVDGFASVTPPRSDVAEPKASPPRHPASLPSSTLPLHTSVPPESVFWLELKLVGQFCNTSGLPGPNRTYTSELTRNPIADLKKLADDDRIHHAGVLLIVFTADEQTAKHDLNVLAHRCMDRNLPIPLGGPITRSFPIPDRIGNTVCTICLIGLRKG